MSTSSNSTSIPSTEYIRSRQGGKEGRDAHFFRPFLRAPPSLNLYPSFSVVLLSPLFFSAAPSSPPPVSTPFAPRKKPSPAQPTARNKRPGPREKQRPNDESIFPFERRDIAVVAQNSSQLTPIKKGAPLKHCVSVAKSFSAPYTVCTNK